MARPSAAGREPSSPGHRQFRMVGKASCTIENNELFPAPLRVSIERFEALPRSFTVTRALARSSGLSLTFSGRIDGYLTSLRQAELALDGSIGEQPIRWIRNAALLPPELTIHALLRSRVQSCSGGPEARHVFREARRSGGDHAVVRSFRQPDAFTVKELRIKDRESEAFLTLHLDQQVLNIGFRELSPKQL